MLPMNLQNNFLQFLKNSELVFKGVRFDVRRCDVPTSTGKKKPHEAMVHPGAVVILPIIEDSIVLIRNYRFAVGETLWELPAGTLEPDESPEKTAPRELAEETGYQAKLIEPLITFFSSPGVSNEILYTYIAKDLTFVGQNLDETEIITTEIIPWSNVMSMVKNGEIRDSKSLVTLLYYSSFCK